MIELGDLGRPVGVHYFCGQRTVDGADMDGAKYSFDAGGGRVDDANKSSGIGGVVCTEADSDSNVDDKAFCPSAAVLDPVSFDHCYVSYQRAAWSLAGSKNGSQGVPRIRKVGLFTHSAEVASKLKQKTVGGDDKTSETAEDVVPCSTNNQEEHEAAAAALATPAAVPEASVPPTTDDAEPEAEPSPDRLDQAVAEELSHDGACTSSTATDGLEAGGGSHPRSPPSSSSSSSSAGCCDHGRSGGQAPTINLSGGFIQFRESQSNAPSGSVLSSFASKPPAPLTPESQVVGRPSALLLQSNSVRQASPVPAGRFLTTVSSVGDLSFGRRLTMGDRCASSAPVLEKYRPASKSSMNSSRSNFDLDDPDQSVYERIRIALQKSEAMKQQQQQQQQQPQAVVVGSDVAEAESVATEKSSDRTARKRPKSEKGKKRAQSSDSKTENAQAFAAEDYTTRCVCGLKHNDELMIQCDLCLVWQHCMCLQLKSSTIPEKYLCEVCEPRPLPLSMEEARRMQLAKLGKGKSGKKKSAKKAAGDAAVKSSSGKADSSDDNKDKKKRLNVIRGDVMEYSSEVERLTKDMETSGCLEEVLNKLRPSPPCRVLLVAPRVHGVVVAYTLAPGVPIVECMGYVAQAKAPKGCARPSSLCDRIFVSDFKVTEAKSIDLCLRLPTDDSLLHHLRRSCRPNSSVSVLSDNGKLRFFLISTKQIDRGWEVTIPFDYDFRTSSRHVPCACSSAYDTPRGYTCPVEEFSKQSRRRKGEKIGSGDPEKKTVDEEEAEAKSKKRRRADGVKKPKKGFRVKFFTKLSSRTVVAPSGSKKQAADAADQTAASSSSPGDGGDSLIMSKREQRKMQSILTSIQMLEARKEKKPRVKSESTSGGEEQLTTVSGCGATGTDGKELDDFKTKKKRWLEDQDRMAAVKGDSTPVQEEEHSQPREASATEDVSTAKSRNELGVSTLLASAVYLNQCNEKPTPAPAQVEEPVVPEEGKRKVRKWSIEEYKRLKRPSLDSTVIGKNSEEASELRPPLVEKPKPVIMDPFVGSSVTVDKAVAETVHLPPLDTVMKAARVDTVAVKVPSCPKAESKGAPVEKKAFEQELEEDDDELMMDRGALVDRLESMRNIFDSHVKEARSAKDVVYNYGSGGQHPPSDLPAFGSPVARPPPPPPAASFYPHVAASLAGSIFMPNYSVPLSSFGQSLYGSAAPSAAFSYYSRVPPPPTRPMAPPIGGYAGGGSGSGGGAQDFMLTHPDMVLTHPDGAPAPLMYMPDHLVNASRAAASVKRSTDVCKTTNGADASGKS